MIKNTITATKLFLIGAKVFIINITVQNANIKLKAAEFIFESMYYLLYSNINSPFS